MQLKRIEQWHAKVQAKLDKHCQVSEDFAAAVEKLLAEQEAHISLGVGGTEKPANFVGSNPMRANQQQVDEGGRGKRAVSAAVVFDALISPHPWAKSTRTPSSVFTFPSANSACWANCSTI